MAQSGHAIVDGLPTSNAGSVLSVQIGASTTVPVNCLTRSGRLPLAGCDREVVRACSRRCAGDRTGRGVQRQPGGKMPALIEYVGAGLPDALTPSL